MRLTVLGKSPSWQDAGGACSSYLVEEGETALLVDLGSGSFGKLRTVRDYRGIDAVVISHFHADHLLDLVPFACALTYGPASQDGTAAPRLLVPPGGGEWFGRLEEAIGDPGLIAGAFAIEEYSPGEALPAGSLRITPHAVRHVGPTHAIEVAAGSRVVFGADGRYSEELVEAARGADLLVAEATLPDPEPGQEVHMSAEEAGRLAAAAGVERLLLTHISDELDVERSRGIAAEAFGGAVEVAAGGSSYEV